MAGRSRSTRYVSNGTQRKRSPNPKSAGVASARGTGEAQSSSATGYRAGAKRGLPSARFAVPVSAWDARGGTNDFGGIDNGIHRRAPRVMDPEIGRGQCAIPRPRVKIRAPRAAAQCRECGVFPHADCAQAREVARNHRLMVLE